MKYCEKCGAEMHDEGVMCVKCGNMTSNNQNSKPKVETTEKYCTKCGGKVSSESTICVHCGCLLGKNVFSSKNNDSIDTAIKAFLNITIFLSVIYIGIQVGLLIYFFAVNKTYLLMPYIVYMCVGLIFSIVNMALSDIALKKIEKKQPFNVGFKICILLFANLIAGILLLVNED